MSDWPDIKFSCSNCGRHLAVDAASAGFAIDCPECGTNLIIPAFNQATAKATSAANPSDNQPPKKQYSETKAEINKRQSFFQKLRLSFSIAKQKTQRQVLESVDLRRAELHLGKAAIEANKFEKEHPEIYSRLKVLQTEVAQRSAEIKNASDFTLKKEIERGAGKIKQGVVTSLKLSAFDQLYLRFAQVIMEQHREDPSVEADCKQIDSIVQRIKVYDEQILELAKNTSFLFRHPAILLGIFALCLMICYGGYLSVSHWWETKKSDEQRANAIKQMTFDLEKSNLEMKKDEQSIQQSVLQSQKKQAELLSQKTSRIASSSIPVTPASNDKLANVIAAAQSTAVSADIQELGNVLFNEIKLTPNLVIDAAFGSATTEIKGDKFPQVVEYTQNKDLSGLISFVIGRPEISRENIADTYDRLKGQRSSRVKFDDYTAHVRPSYGVPAGSKIHVIRFRHYNPLFITDVERRRGNNLQNLGDYQLEVDTESERYPDGIGFLINYHLVGERIVIIVAPEPHYINPNTGPFQLTAPRTYYSFDEKYFRPMQQKYRAQQDAINKLRRLGDIDDAECMRRLQQLEDTFYESASNLANNSVR